MTGPATLTTRTGRRSLWILGALALCVLPHATRLPVWIVPLFLLLLGWRAGIAVGRWRMPPTAVRLFITLTSIAAAYLSFGSFRGRSAGIGVLIILLGMKLLESRNLRDVYLAGFLGYFVLITNFFYSQSISMASYMLTIVLIMTAGLIGLNDPGHGMPDKARLRLAGVIMVQALPVMLIAFLLFPRINGPLWGLPQDTWSGLSGISDHMSPGNISRLSLSDAVAFRVRFDGPMPEAAQLYWRGPVLWHTDGRTWSAGDLPAGEAEPVSPLGKTYHYTITLEPNQQRWLFGLDIPVSIPDFATLSRDHQLLTARPVSQRLRYRVSSVTRYRDVAIGRREFILARQLPADLHPKARQLAQSWAAEETRPAAVVERALSMFRNQPYYYTRTPQRLSGDSIDQFLFDTRRGFCEHYAAAFTVLMRAAGIPARVVIGFQGGELNTVGDYLVVRQRDAHAWSEVWLAERGWVRIDPTGAVSPERIEQGIDTVITPGLGPEILGLTPTSTVGSALRELRQVFDAVNNGWNQWVLAYGPKRQSRLMGRLGFDGADWAGMVIGMTFAVLLVLVAVYFILTRSKASTDPARLLYDQFCARLARRGLRRRSYEGPVDFAHRASRARPDLRDPITNITRLYADLRYSNRAEPTINALAAAVRAFRP